MDFLSFTALVLFLMFIKICVSQNNGFPLVSTSKGVLRGLKAGRVTKFLGVPYALPPIGNLRFKVSQPYSSWDEVKIATQHGADCAQPYQRSIDFMPPHLYNKLSSIEYSEDCLNLDIYIPGTVEAAKSRPKPVMVWFHGGGYITGSKTLFGIYNGDKLAYLGNVIIVNINYRLAAFGFLPINHSDFDDNVGLWDQNLALQWVQDNIVHFGGDPRQVTIFGESAGGMSVTNHIVSPHSKGLFQRAIVQSGVNLPTSLTVDQGFQYTTLGLAKTLDCPIQPIDDLAKCIQNKTTQELSDASLINIFFPVIDGNFIPDVPETLMRTAKFNKVPLLIGYNSGKCNYL